MNLCFIGGLGDDAAAWNGVISSLPAEWSTTAFSLSDLCSLEPFTLDSAVTALGTRLAAVSSRTHLVGLSAGAMVALRYGASHEIASLLLCSPQMRPPAALMHIQQAIFYLMPERLFQSSGASKREVMHVADALAGVDLTPDARRIAVPTTIACGSADKANIRAARRTSQTIPNSRLLIVDDARHEWHKQLPQQFVHALMSHLLSDSSTDSSAEN